MKCGFFAVFDTCTLPTISNLRRTAIAINHEKPICSCLVGLHLQVMPSCCDSPKEPPSYSDPPSGALFPRLYSLSPIALSLLHSSCCWLPVSTCTHIYTQGNRLIPSFFLGPARYLLRGISIRHGTPSTPTSLFIDYASIAHRKRPPGGTLPPQPASNRSFWPRVGVAAVVHLRETVLDAQSGA